MNKLMAFFVFTFIAGSMIGLSFEGANGIASTRLTTNITKADTAIPVGSVTGFLGSDFLQIGNETIKYTGRQTSGTIESFTGSGVFHTCPCFIEVIRGVNNHADESTEAKSHKGPGDPAGNRPEHGSTVMSTSTSIVNNAVGFNLAEEMSTAGVFKTVVTSPFIIMKTVVKLVAWDFSFLEGKYVFFKFLILYPISAGFIWSMWAMFSGTAISILRR